MKRKHGLIESINSLIRLIRGKPNIPPTLRDNAMLSIILNRRSVRSFTKKRIPDDVFTAILEAARMAPSTVNLQTWSFMVFDNALWKKTFNRSISFHGDRAVIVIADTYRDRQVLDVFPDCPLVENTVAVMNASLAAMNMNIAAEALGVSSVMLSETGQCGLLDADYLKEKLSLPAHAFPLMTIVFGYALGTYPPMPPKLTPEQIIFKNCYMPPDREKMESWLSQMMVGYKASHLNSSFESQLNIYQRKMITAEENLQKMIFNRDNSKK